MGSADNAISQLLIQCQNKQERMRRKAGSRPDAQSHHRLHLLDRDVDINFRYYSPSKSVSSQSVASEQKMKSIPLSDSSDMLDKLAEIFPKKALDAREGSDKFYQQEINDARNSLIPTYQKFQAKLLQPHLKAPQELPMVKRITRLNLSQARKNQSNKRLKNSEPLKQIRKNFGKNQRKSYIKRAHINLFSQEPQKIAQQKNKVEQNNEYMQKISIERKARLKIKLYDDKRQQNESNLVYITPRSHSKSKKGIRVFSSASTKKHQDTYCTEKQAIRPLILRSNETKKLRESQKRASLSRKISKFSQYEDNSLDRKKKRVLSREKLDRSSKPKIFLFKENQ